MKNKTKEHMKSENRTHTPILRISRYKLKSSSGSLNQKYANIPYKKPSILVILRWQISFKEKRFAKFHSFLNRNKYKRGDLISDHSLNGIQFKPLKWRHQNHNLFFIIFVLFVNLRKKSLFSHKIFSFN